MSNNVGRVNTEQAPRDHHRNDFSGLYAAEYNIGSYFIRSNTTPAPVYTPPTNPWDGHEYIRTT